MSSAVASMRLVLVSDGQGEPDRLLHIVTAAVAGGLRAVQLREPGMSTAVLATLCRELRPLLEQVDGLLLVNDRADLVSAGLAHGVHLGAHSLTPGEVRRFLPKATIGFSAHDAVQISWARQQGADYVSLSPVLTSTCKPGVAAIGIDAATQMTVQAALPVIWLGGFDAGNAHLLPSSAAGLALRTGLCEVADPAAAARSILKA